LQVHFSSAVGTIGRVATDAGRGSTPLDAASFDSFYRDHRGEVFRYVLRDVGNRADAEEITQTAFLDAYRALRRGHAPELPRAWMYGIARNAARRRFRTQSRRPREVELVPELEETLASEPDADAPAIRAAVADLRPNYREAVFLREVEGLSYAEIGARMNLSQAAVETLLFRARRMLRDRFEAEGIVPAVRRGLRRARGLILAPVGFWRDLGKRADLLQADIAAKAAVGVAVVATGAGIAVSTGALPVRAASEKPRPQTSAPAETPHRPGAMDTVAAVQLTGQPAEVGRGDGRRDSDYQYAHQFGASDATGGAGASSDGGGSGTGAGSSESASVDGSSAGTAGVGEETPSVETPSLETPSVETPSVETPSVGTLSVEVPSLETPSVEVPLTVGSVLVGEASVSVDGAVAVEGDGSSAGAGVTVETPSLEAPSLEAPSIDPFG